MGNSNANQSGSSSGDSDEEKKGPVDRMSNTFRNLTVVGATRLIALVTIVGVLAVANNLGGGPAMFDWLFAALGWETPSVLSSGAGLLILLVVLLVGSALLDMFGFDTGVPFWMGIVLMILLVMKYVVPDFVRDAFAPLRVGEIFLGVPLGEMDVLGATVLGFVFIFSYYTLQYRIGGEIDNPKYPGSKSLISAVKNGGITYSQRLFRNYIDLIVSLAAFFGVTGFLATTGAGQAAAAFIGETMGAIVFEYPVWSGYLGSLAAWYMNSMAAWWPIEFGAEQFGVVLLLILVATGAIYLQN